MMMNHTNRVDDNVDTYLVGDDDEEDDVYADRACI